MFGLTPHDLLYAFVALVVPSAAWAHRNLTGYLRRIEGNTTRTKAELRFLDARTNRLEDRVGLQPLDRRLWLPGDEPKEATR